jgi:ech hydrogenase subunit F
MSDILQMFGLVIKSLFKKSACDMYPVKKPEFYDRSRGRLAIEESKCILCSLCARKCPTSAITVDRNHQKWTIDHGKCILCERCVEACPTKCLHMAKQYTPPTTTKQLEEAHPPPPKGAKSQ